ncbi:hypothetical protein ACFRCW_22790 [Streptomyces sp. NPDC056653]
MTIIMAPETRVTARAPSGDLDNYPSHVIAKELAGAADLGA